MTTFADAGFSQDFTAPVIAGVLARIRNAERGRTIRTNPVNRSGSATWVLDGIWPESLLVEGERRRVEQLEAYCDEHPILRARARQRLLCSPTQVPLRRLLAAGRSRDEIAFYTCQPSREVETLCRAHDLPIPPSRPLRQYRHPRYLTAETKRAMIELWGEDETRAGVDKIAAWVGRTRRQTLGVMRRLGFRYGRGGADRAAYRAEFNDLRARSLDLGINVIPAYAESLPKGFPGADVRDPSRCFSEIDPPPPTSEHAEPGGLAPVGPLTEDGYAFWGAEQADEIRPASARAPQDPTPGVGTGIACREAPVPLTVPAAPAIETPAPLAPVPWLPPPPIVSLIRPRANPRQLADRFIGTYLEQIQSSIDSESFRTSKTGSEKLVGKFVGALRAVLRIDYYRTGIYLEPSEPRTQKGWSDEERTEILIRTIGQQHREGIAQRFGANVNAVTKMMILTGVNRKSWKGFATRHDFEKRRAERFIFNLNNFRDSPFWQKYRIRWCPYAGYFWAREIDDPRRYSPRKVALKLEEMRH